MLKLSDVLMMDGGWGFSVSRADCNKPIVWIAYAIEEEARVGREAMAKAIENVVDVLT